MGKIAGGRSMIAPTITRPYRYPERDVEGAVPYEGIGLFRLFSIIPKGYIHAPWRNSCRRQFMEKPIHARQGNSLAIGRSAAPGRERSELLGKG